MNRERPNKLARGLWEVVVGLTGSAICTREGLVGRRFGLTAGHGWRHPGGGFVYTWSIDGPAAVVVSLVVLVALLALVAHGIWLISSHVRRSGPF